MFECVQICTVSDMPRRHSSTRRRYDLHGAACLVSSADRCSVSCMVCLAHLARPALLPVLCSPSGCAGGLGLHRRGIGGAPGVGWSTPRVEKIQKKAFSKIVSQATHPLFPVQNHPTPITNLQNFPQKQKDPYKGSVFCAILALQALKGRNLQWLKVK